MTDHQQEQEPSHCQYIMMRLLQEMNAILKIIDEEKSKPRSNVKLIQHHLNQHSMRMLQFQCYIKYLPQDHEDDAYDINGP